MPEAVLKRIDEMEAQIKALSEWKKKKEAQQITYPLDKASEDALTDKGIPVVIDRSASTITADKSLSIVVGGQKYQINAL